MTLTPTLAFKDGKPWLAFAVQGGDTQDQNLLQFFLNIVEFGMTPQQAAEAPNFNSYQMHDSFDQHEIFPGRITLNNSIPDWVRRELRGARLQARVRLAHLRADQRDPARPGSTARSGAGRATTARTTASPGKTKGTVPFISFIFLRSGRYENGKNEGDCPLRFSSRASHRARPSRAPQD